MLPYSILIPISGQPVPRCRSWGKRVGVTAILGKSYQEEIRNPDLSFTDPAEALAKVVPQLKQQADILVLLAYAARDEAIALVREFPEFAVVAISDGPAEPPGAPQFVPDTQTMLVFVGEKGMAAAVVGIYERNNPPMAYQRVILDSRYPDSPAMKEMMATYQAQLQALGWRDLRYVRLRIRDGKCKASSSGPKSARPATKNLIGCGSVRGIPGHGKRL